VAKFLSKLLLEDSGGLPFTVQSLFIYQTDSNELISVPIGFQTDLASIPRGLWNLFPPVGKYDRAAVVHDFLYRFPGTKTRAQCDSVFREALGACGVSRFTQWTLYLAVRSGGWKPWNRYRAAQHV
jgi:hypothetical protein